MIALYIGIFACKCIFGAVYNSILKKRHELELEKLETIFDQVIHNKFDPETVKYSEGQVHKVIFKAKRVAEIAEERKHNVEIEHQHIQELITDISHQMRTPLTSIMMYTELLQSMNLPEGEAKEFLERIEVSSERLMWLASEFIIMTRFETATMKLHPVLEDVNKTLQKAILENQEAAKQKKILISGDFNQANLLVHDSKWTGEAFSNVIDNAVKYSHEKSKIQINIERLLSYTRVDITSYGIGVSDDAIRLISQKYYRGENAKELPGAGIGLYLTKSILEEQGGYMLVKQEQERTIFSLFLLN